MTHNYKLPGSNLVPPRYRRYYARSLVLLGIFLLGLVGYQLYQRMLEERNQEANKIFWQLSSALADQDAETLDSSYEILQEQGNEHQLVLAKFLVARAAMDEDDPQAAAQIYRDIIEMTSQAGLKDIAGIRLARLLAVEQQYDEAWEVAREVEESDHIQFVALISELKGDMYMLQNDFDAARKNYEKAFKIAQTLNESGYISFIESKLKMVYSAQLKEVLS